LGENEAKKPDISRLLWRTKTSQAQSATDRRRSSNLGDYND